MYRNTIRLRDVRTGRVRATIRLANPYLTDLAVSRDGSLVATATGLNQPRDGIFQYGPIQLWSGRNGKLLRTLRSTREQKSIVYSLAFSPDGQTLASGGGDTNVRLWSVHTGREQRVMSLGTFVFALVFSPDGKRLAAAGGRVTYSEPGVLVVWSLPQIKKLLSAPLDGDVSYSLIGFDFFLPQSFVFSPDSRYLLTGGLVWDSRKKWHLFDARFPEPNDTLGSFIPQAFVGASTLLGFHSPLNESSIAPAWLDLRTRRFTRGSKPPSDVNWLRFAPGGYSLLGLESRNLEDRVLKSTPFIQRPRSLESGRSKH